jgi:hypothetical protein
MASVTVPDNAFVMYQVLDGKGRPATVVLRSHAADMVYVKVINAYVQEILLVKIAIGARNTTMDHNVIYGVTLLLHAMVMASVSCIIQV